MSSSELESVIDKAGFPRHWKDGLHDENGGDPIMDEELLRLGVKDGRAWATDDVSGASLDPVKVKETRAVEMDYFRRMRVYTKVPRWKPKGSKIVRTKWIDINKGDSVNPDIRSRLVGKEFNNGEEDGLFAATPPLEALRFVLSHAATWKSDRSRERRAIMVNDVRRAYCYAKATRDLYIELPEEDPDASPGTKTSITRAKAKESTQVGG